MAQIKRSARRSLPVWVWAVAASLVGIVLVAWAYYSSQPSPVVKRPSEPARSRPSRPRPKPPPPPKLEPPPPGATKEEIIKYVQHAIVKIDVYHDTWNPHQSLGSGFIIDKQRMLVVTNYHVTCHAEKADVLFHNGDRFGVEGYMAVRPDYDLAILKINRGQHQGVVSELKLRWQDDPSPPADVFAIGHPVGFQFVVSSGQVQTVMPTRRLPQSEQQWVAQELVHADRPDTVWIMHTAALDQGNSGGPVINTAGHVLGVNTWISPGRTGQRNFAIHAKHINEMLSGLSAGPEPLKKYHRAAGPSSPSGGQKITLEQFKKVYGAAAATGWKPASGVQYEAMCDFAALWTITRLQMQGSDREFGQLHAGTRQEWQKELNGVVDALKKVAWDGARLKATNTAAAAADPERLDGVFLFGSVHEVYEARGRSLMKVGVTGTNKAILVPVPPKVTPLAKGSRCLVIGLVFDFHNVGANPLKQDLLPLVVAPTLVKLEVVAE